MTQLIIFICLGSWLSVGLALYPHNLSAQQAAQPNAANPNANAAQPNAAAANANPNANAAQPNAAANPNAPNAPKPLNCLAPQNRTQRYQCFVIRQDQLWERLRTKQEQQQLVLQERRKRQEALKQSTEQALVAAAELKKRQIIESNLQYSRSRNRSNQGRTYVPYLPFTNELNR